MVHAVLPGFDQLKWRTARRELSRLSWLAAQTLADGVTDLRVEQSVDPCDHKWTEFL